MDSQTLSLIFSFISNLLWLFVFIPQLYKNYENKKSEAISLSLLFCLILGDLFLFISSIAKSLNYVIIYTILYHIFLDIIIIGQSIYYRFKKYNGIEESIQLIDENYFEYKCFYFTLYETLFIIFTVIALFFISFFFVLFENTIYMANLIAWISTISFISARIPQIFLNAKRKSTKGLSFISFIIINIANIFFLLSILIFLIDLEKHEYLNYIESILYFIVGGILSTLLDIIIFYQFFKYNRAIDRINLEL